MHMPVSNIKVIDLIVNFNYGRVSEKPTSTLKNSFFQKSTHLFKIKYQKYSTRKIIIIQFTFPYIFYLNVFKLPILQLVGKK